MADFNQMGGLPTGYSDLLNSARQQLVKMPDGTYTVAPQFGGSSNINELYQGIYPPAMSAPPVSSSGLRNNYVPTYQVRSDGTPIIPGEPGFTADSGTDTRIEQSGARRAYTQGVQPAGTVAMPLGARPASVPLPSAIPAPPQPTMLAGMFGRGQGGYWSGSLKDQAQLPSNDGGEAGFLQAFGPGASQSPAVTAIDQAAGMPPLPRIRPLPPARIPLTSVAPPGAGSPPSVPGAITFKKGDTVSALAKQRGMTVSSFSDLFGIKNPNKIYAGQTVFRQAPPVPMPGRPMALSVGRPPPVPRMEPAAFSRARQIAEGKASQLDEFGMIR
jgi:LysM repeat protein